MKQALVIIKGKVKGLIIMKDTKKGLQMKIDLQNIKEGYHGFHIHQYGNMLNGCETLGGHYNPKNQVHGSLTSKIRHSGDLGNIKANSNNICKKTLYVKDLVINELLGRSIVIHEKKDDLGEGLNEESKKTGNAGKRIGCGIIALMSE